MQLPSLLDIAPAAQAEIERRLSEIEMAHDVRIILAVESGSRAWGFASPDSDYDGRFIYAHRRDWYLSLREGRDVIETPIEGDMDVNGWDLRKALRLALTSNPILIEWLTSPIVYRQTKGADLLRSFAVGARSRRALVRHYLGLLQNSWARDFKDSRSDVSLKKYFYVIRPSVALAWLRTRDDTPPMTLAALIDGIGLGDALASSIESLRRRKAETNELGRGGRLGAIDAFVSEQLIWAQGEIIRLGGDINRPSDEEADQLFRTLISWT